MRVALVHDWLTGMRGGEKVLELLCERFPEATLFTLLRVPGSVSPTIERHRIVTSFVQHLPGSTTHYRHYLPLFPAAIERLDLVGFDLVISSSHCAAKGVIPPAGARHLCYCHTPMRYAWDQYDAYFAPERLSWLERRLIPPIMTRLRRWDVASAARVDRFAANSRHVANRISRYYNRTASVIYPPVDTEFYCPDGSARADYALIVSALAPYKRIGLAIEACNRLRVPLKIVGTGPEAARLRARAGPTIEFLGSRSDQDLRDLYRRAALVLLPGEEDFGIVPLEAQACGTPVVALGRGGATESVIENETGVFFADPAPEAIAEALQRARRQPFDPLVLRAQALNFSRERFRARFEVFLSESLAQPADRRW